MSIERKQDEKAGEGHDGRKPDEERRRAMKKLAKYSALLPVTTLMMTSKALAS